jgi:hypothetical protein
MLIKKLILEKFKRIDRVVIDLEKINVLVGGNNTGKSSVLQGLHFSVTVGAVQRQQGQETFSSDFLIYNPALDFTLLRNGSPYKNMGDEKESTLTLIADANGQEMTYKIEINKGRNHGNINCKRSGDQYLGSVVTDPNNLFTIYVPGLAGIPQAEELKSKAIVRRGVASGDANLYLRNVIYYIQQNGKLDVLNSYLHSIFNDLTLNVKFDIEKDTSLVVYAHTNSRQIPLELLGTGTLQIVQILSYITYFNPKLILLDEPDSHLHPNNQFILAEALQEISEKTNTQIILCTHSRHIIDALYGQANFIWLKDGTVNEQGYTINKLPLLMDIGALDELDRLRQGELDFVFLTEDRKKEFILKLLLANDFDLSRIMCLSYRSSSNLEAAAMLVDFIKEVSNNTKVVIHRDRDFMTNDEVERISKRIREADAIPFITKGSDIESYFIEPNHISSLLGEEVSSVIEWIDQLALDNHVLIQQEFLRKRDEIKHKLYSRHDSWPDPISISGTSIPFPPHLRKGKTMIRKINCDMYRRFGKEVNLVQVTPHLKCPELQSLLRN